LIPRRVSDKRDHSGKPKLIDGNNLPDAIASQTKSKKPPFRIERRLLFDYYPGTPAIFP
jgi:hypothetical protein